MGFPLHSALIVDFARSGVKLTWVTHISPAYVEIAGPSGKDKRVTRRCILILLAFVVTAAGDLAVARYRAGYEIAIDHPHMGVIPPGLELWARNSAPGGRVWVRFKDRGSTGGSFVPLSDRALARRLRQGIPLMTADRQPVAPEYIAEIVRSGARIRRVSRWLNAVSIAYDAELVNRLAQLPFVARIEPVRRYFRMPDAPTSRDDVRSTPPAGSPAGLDYGSSFAQLEQIGADLAHAREFTGAGVLVAMFDTGFRKDHEAFASALAEGRLMAEWDFVFDDGDTQNEGIDHPNAHNHGTSTWSVLGGAYPGQLYGPAYGASFLLAKTEDIRSETPVEEDNWLAAVEWAEALGADVISSSLTYSDWYSFSAYDGLTAITTLAADLAASLGIVVCNAAGNAGPGTATIGAPVDAFGMLSVGSVTSTGTISSFSSRGPTFDGRIKPEICARGSATFLAQAGSTTAFGNSSGTSFSCPLAGGCAALVIEAHPAWNPLQVREALMQTASQADTPDNVFGWGIIDVNAALDYAGSVQVSAVPPSDTLLSYAATFDIAAFATTASAVDFAKSALYYRTDGGAYLALPLVPHGTDSVAASLPSPSDFLTTVAYYFLVEDTVGFFARAPQTPGEAYALVFMAWLPGDLNKNKDLTVADVLMLVNYVLKSAPEPEPVALAETDGGAGITLADIIYVVNYVFKGGPPPVRPS